MEFYQSVLGGELRVMTFGESGQEGLPADGVMHSELRTPEGFFLMASDSPDGMPYQAGTNVTVALVGDDPKLREHFDGLSQGGQVTVPLEKQMWGAEFGMLVDRFGIVWMINIGGQ